MALLAQTLITRSWFLSGIVARNLQSVTGDQINDGLQMLNALLDFKQIETELIPYFTYDESYTAVIGQETYFIENCAAIESVTFNLGVVRYPMNYTNQRAYFGSARVDNINSLPFSYTFNRQKGGGDLYLYFLPQDTFPLKIFGKFFLTDVDLDTDMEAVYDKSYIEYLRYALAQYMCSEMGVEFSPQATRILEQYKKKLMYVTGLDLTNKKQTILQSKQCPGMSFGDVNIGRGWRPQ
jgi:hypothetical protein